MWVHSLCSLVKGEKLSVGAAKVWKVELDASHEDCQVGSIPVGLLIFRTP